jgi:hypothetical protein
MLEKNNIHIVCYHYPCPDGVGSMYAAQKFHNSIGNLSVKYIAITASLINTIDWKSLVKDKNVLFVDLALKQSFITEIIKYCNQYLVIDHHKTTEKELEIFPKENLIFDIKKSGAILTWCYFFPDQEPPLLLKYIQDNDLWINKMPNCDKFVAWFHHLPMTYEIYDQYANDDNKLIEDIKKCGSVALTIQNSILDKAINFLPKPKFVQINNKYYFILFANFTIYPYILGDKILGNFPYIDLSSVYYINVNGGTNFTLLSTPTRVDGSEIAKHFGGQGHRNSSMLTLQQPANHFGTIISNSDNLYSDLFSSDSLFLNSDEILGTYQIVYLEYNQFQEELGQYLLQDKYDNVQNCQYIRLVHSQISISPVRIQIAAIFSYDKEIDKTLFTLSFDHSMNIQQINSIKLMLNTEHQIFYNGKHKKLM